MQLLLLLLLIKKKYPSFILVKFDVCTLNKSCCHHIFKVNPEEVLLKWRTGRAHCGRVPLLKSTYRCVNKRPLSASCDDAVELTGRGSPSPGRPNHRTNHSTGPLVQFQHYLCRVCLLCVGSGRLKVDVWPKFRGQLREKYSEKKKK